MNTIQSAINSGVAGTAALDNDGRVSVVVLGLENTAVAAAPTADDHLALMDDRGQYDLIRSMCSPQMWIVIEEEVAVSYLLFLFIVIFDHPLDGTAHGGNMQQQAVRKSD